MSRPAAVSIVMCAAFLAPPDVASAAEAAAVDTETATDTDSDGDSETETETAAEKGTLGVGIILGEPTGLSARLYVSDDQAIQAGAGYAFISAGLHIHADYVFHPAVLQARDSFVMLAYVGPGVRAIQYRDSGESDYVALGVRGVGGLLFDFKDHPIDVFVEVAGIVEVGSNDEGLGFKLNVAAGGRYYF